MARPRITAIHPLWAVPGGRITVEGSDLVSEPHSLPEVRLGPHAARVVRASPRELAVVVPAESEGGQTPIRVEGAPGKTAFVEIGRQVATGLHLVDGPVIDRDGRVYLTYSGSRGESSRVSVFRVDQDGFREPLLAGIMNATSMAMAPDGRLHVSSRFDGTVYRVESDGTYSAVASDLGVACGLAFSPDGTLYVGDRTGTVFRVGTSDARFRSHPCHPALRRSTWPGGQMTRCMSRRPRWRLVIRCTASTTREHSTGLRRRLVGRKVWPSTRAVSSTWWRHSPVQAASIASGPTDRPPACCRPAVLSAWPSTLLVV